MVSETPEPDKSHGYEEFAGRFMHARNMSIGPAIVKEWIRSLARGGPLLDVGCGFGLPISQALAEEGFQIYGVDASEKMIRAFRERFPSAPAEHAAAEDSSFFDRQFDGVIAWGLMFLLPEDLQRIVIAKAARALMPGGRLLFTSPEQRVHWNDSITGRECRSLGADAYDELLESLGLIVTGHAFDEGENYYYFAMRPER